jgi:hypothetical protein
MIRHSLLAFFGGNFLGLGLGMLSYSLRAHLKLGMPRNAGANVFEAYARPMVLLGIAWAAIAAVVAGVPRSSLKHRMSQSILAALLVAAAAVVIEIIHDWQNQPLPEGAIAAFFLFAPIYWGVLVASLAFLLSRS